MNVSGRVAAVKRTLRYYEGEYRRILGIGLLSFVSAFFQAFALVLVVPLAKAITEGRSHYVGRLAQWRLDVSTGKLAVLAAVSIVVAFILDSSISWFRSTLMTQWEFRMRERVVNEFVQADYEVQAGERLGTLGTLTSYVNRGTVMLGALVNVVGALFTMVLFLGSAFLLDARAAVFMLGAIAIVSLLLRPLMVRTKRYAKALSAMLLDYAREVTETTRMAREMRVYHAAEPVSDRLTRISARVARVRQRSAFANTVTSPVYQYAGMGLIIGGLMAVQGLPARDVANFGAIALLLLRSMTFGSQIQNAYQTVLDASPYLEKLAEMRTVYEQHTTQDGTISLEPVRTLELDDVRFTYNGETNALDGVTAALTTGEIVGIVGPSGSGKSTLSQLVLRLRTATGGQLRCNGVAAAEYTLASWYRRISLVPQDPRLLHASVADNIAFLDATISRDQVVEAAKQAGVHDVIMELQRGYDTLVGPAFRDLSGGQIQRIGIARALVRQPDVLVLDEPTSALDVHSEAVIQESLERLRGKVLVIIIAHRLSTLSICDRVMVLQAGRIETIGDLSELSERSEFFRRALDAGTLEVGVPQELPEPTRDET